MMSDLQKVLEIAKDVYSKENKKVEEEFLNFMKNEAKSNIEQLNIWLMNQNIKTYNSKLISQTGIDNIINAGNNLGFNVTQIDKHSIKVYIPKSDDETEAQKLLETYISLFEKEKAKVDELAEKNFTILMEEVKKRNFTVIKRNRIWQINVPFPKNSELTCAVIISFIKLLKQKGFSNPIMKNNICIFEIVEKKDAKCTII